MSTKRWNEQMIEQALTEICKSLGYFPSASELRERGRNDVAIQIGRKGGYQFWAEKIGVDRRPSDSDTGWEGEAMFHKMAEDQSIGCTKPEGVKCPFDRLLGDYLRIDVKSARKANYGKFEAWYYRIGKIPQADVVVLLQLDTKNFYAIPWWDCSTSNVTISESIHKRYAHYYNSWQLIRKLLNDRQAEAATIRGVTVAA